MKPSHTPICGGTLRYLAENRDRESNKNGHELKGIKDPDFLALGLGCTNLIAMLWAVAMGRRAVGVEIRGDPFLGVHWNVREDLYHQLGQVDQMMRRRYGKERIPRQMDGTLISLADSFYSSRTEAGDIVPDEIIDGFNKQRHIGGVVRYIEYIDDRWKDGMPSRTITEPAPPDVPKRPDPSCIRTNMQEVLDGPSTYQGSALCILRLLRRYLEKMEQLDLQQGHEPRVRLFTHHRVIEELGKGFVPQEDGRLSIAIEEVTEIDFKGKLSRVRTPNTDIIHIGVPELFSIAQGFHSSDAERLGFRQKDVRVDHGDGRGEIVAQADYVAGLIEVLVDGRLRRRIASEFDKAGNEYWVRQIAVGHENDPEIGWVVVQVPDFMTLCPIEAGLVPHNTCKESPEYFAAYQILLYDFFIEQASLVLEMDPKILKGVQMVYGPKLFNLVERVGEDPQIAPNGVIAGDSFGNGHFLTSAGAMTGMVGHAYRFMEYWQRLDQGKCHESSIRHLSDQIKNDTLAWLGVSAKEFSEAIPINFGANRGSQIAAASGIDLDRRANTMAAGRRERHGLLPLDSSDWRRIFVRNGRTVSDKLPPINPIHPALRSKQRVLSKL
ncbi:unnamed protein product [Clonostachys rosea]|uniref:FHA domain-containing protein n=1 Tax=Bionectria ochroleuca TaxID=29856 RepID=A0ABY6UMK4_BIOOC|nr:unnamed protein product [Clonostachys rosea]